MTAGYERDLDLNLLRTFVVVAEEGSVTAAARRLYVTQPAVSAALARLQRALAAPLFVRRGRGVALSSRGERLYRAAKPHLDGLLAAAVSPAAFDPATHARTVRLGVSDASEGWLLAPLLARLSRDAPRMQLVVLPVQFRTVGEALSTGRVDLAVTVADDLPRDVRREALFTGGFACVFDPRHASMGRRLDRRAYFAHEHVVVSYNADLRGIVEDLLGERRRVRVSVPSFHGIGAVVEGSALVATVPELIGRRVVAERPKLALSPVPLPLEGTAMELLHRAASDDDDALSFVRGLIREIGEEAASSLRFGRPPRAARRGARRPSGRSTR